MANGAIDNEFADAEHSTKEILAAAVADFDTDLTAGSIALDLVTRQPLFVRRQVAETLVKHYEQETFDLYSYGVHPYLPVRLEDAVYECVFLSDLSVDSLAGFNDAQTYDFPRGRLAHVPVEQAWGGGDG